MKSRFSKILARLMTPSGLLVLVVVLGLSFVALVLVPGLELAGEVAERSTALTLLGEQQRHPTLIRASLESVRERLNARGYFEDSLDQLRTSNARLDAALHQMTVERPVGWFASLVNSRAAGSPIAGKHAALLLDSWARERVVLNPVLGFHGVPYQDNETSGTYLTDSGKDLERDVTAALRASRRVLPVLDSEFSAIANELQSANVRSSNQLRLIMLSGLVIALALGGLVSVLLSARQRQENSLRLARQQTVDILRTVKDGLFLVDRNLLIGSVYSSALENLFQRKDFEGLAFESLLKNIVSARTMATALKYVKILWSERTNEKLVRTINPLGEVEVHLDGANGKSETRFLQFDFHRVRQDGVMTHVLVSVSDVTARVDLTMELHASKTQAQDQVDTLLGILQIDPTQLQSFLNDSNTAMKMINAVLREPSREEGVFRKKLDSLFRQVHSVKGEAAALHLSSIESRAHAFEEDLKALRDRPTLSGNDFIPLVIKLDDLLTHLQSVSDMVSRLSRMQIAQHDVPHTITAVIEEEEKQKPDGVSDAAPDGAPDGAPDRVPDGDHSGAPGGGANSRITATLTQLAARVARENNREIVLQCTGFEAIPEQYRRAVKDISIQAVRNAIVHGIETPAEREAAGKPREGAVRLAFQDAGEAGYKLVAEDDGQGLAIERIKQVAVKKGLITQERAQTMNAKQVYGLLFKSGFSTVETATKDAGRGVGMNLIADVTSQIGGRVSLATSAGKFMRLTTTLPRAPKRADKAEAA
jgi:PAS domain-containing protein/HPt (histidine-containing phosphotransfer) domain-containing protein